jgi:hypothetical protein
MSMTPLTLFNLLEIAIIVVVEKISVNKHCLGEVTFRIDVSRMA